MRGVLALTIVASGWSALVAVQPANAVCGGVAPPYWTSEQQVMDYQSASCGRNYVNDPGVGTVLDGSSTSGNEALLTPSRFNFYLSQGFNANWLWYQPTSTIVARNDDTRQWTGCTVGVSVGGTCASLKRAPMGDDFAADTELRVIGDESVFIVLACGNYGSNEFFVPANPVPVPTPVFAGVKFRDDNRNGVRDGGEPTIAGWEINLYRDSSSVGQAAGNVLIGTTHTNSAGEYRFELLDQGPGTYRVQEASQPGWANYTPISYSQSVGFRVGNPTYTFNFGNAPTSADVAKTAMRITAAPAHFNAGEAADVSVEVTLSNAGPAQTIPVEDLLEVTLPVDCSTPSRRQRFGTTLTAGSPQVHTFVFPITCTRPSNHTFRFDDALSIANPAVTDPNPANNTANVTIVRPVHAYTDLATVTALACAATTNVGVSATCTTNVQVTNSGFGGVDATASTSLLLPSDCTSVPASATKQFLNMGASASEPWPVTFGVVCTHRSFHLISAQSNVIADDVHVFDTDSANNRSTDGPRTMEVFHDAAMSVVDLYPRCNDSVGALTFSCTAEVTVSKTGPAPLVAVDVWAEMSVLSGCSAGPAVLQTQAAVLGSAPLIRTFTWNVTCPASPNLYPFQFRADLRPGTGEPHAVDAAGAVSVWRAVPTCTPTVNPHGVKQPQAPGNGMNEDGFYIFGTLPASLGLSVSIRDTGSNKVFGPFANGTRIKWVEANGAVPSIKPAAGNNGNGGNAIAVDWHVTAKGDALAFIVDARGNEIRALCLVPPFPK